MTFSITLGVKRKLDAGQPSPVRKKSPPPRVNAEAILRRDDYTCQYCGFRSSRFQRVIPRDWAAADTSASNLVTACTFCEQCFALETVTAMGSGSLLWLPEISQADLNHIARAIYVAKAEDSGLATAADSALEALKARRSDIKRRIGGDDPMILATVLLENLEDDEYRKRGEKLDGVRLLPLDKRVVAGRTGDINQFPAMLNYWRSADGPFGQIPSDSWQEMLHATTETIGKA
ncbi:MAG: type IV secretion protein DotN [Alphaproteobacteria bacterium]|nr:type IV secretion protein DotN [Alphaproteobacteria bacterium]